MAAPIFLITDALAEEEKNKRTFLSGQPLRRGSITGELKPSSRSSSQRGSFTGEPVITFSQPGSRSGSRSGSRNGSRVGSYDNLLDLAPKPNGEVYRVSAEERARNKTRRGFVADAASQSRNQSRRGSLMQEAATPKDARCSKARRSSLGSQSYTWGPNDRAYQEFDPSAQPVAHNQDNKGGTFGQRAGLVILSQGAAIAGTVMVQGAGMVQVA